MWNTRDCIESILPRSALWIQHYLPSQWFLMAYMVFSAGSSAIKWIRASNVPLITLQRETTVWLVQVSLFSPSVLTPAPLALWTALTRVREQVAFKTTLWIFCCLTFSKTTEQINKSAHERKIEQCKNNNNKKRLNNKTNESRSWKNTGTPNVFNWKAAMRDKNTTKEEEITGEVLISTAKWTYGNTSKTIFKLPNLQLPLVLTASQPSAITE